MSDSTGDAPRSQGRYPKGIARRQEILDTAIRVFAQRGSKKTSLRAIGQEVGVTHAALTHYFGSLEELLVAVYRESERQSDEVESDTPDETPARSMRLAAEKNRDVPGLVQLYSTLVATALEDDRHAAQEFITARFARLRAEITAQVRRFQASGRLRADIDPALASALVIAASDGLQTQWLLDPDVDHEAALDLLDRLLSTD